jgi:hypothetical protein
METTERPGGRIFCLELEGALPASGDTGGQPPTDEADGLERLCERLTEEFLATLVEAVRQYGWAGDYTEVVLFVQWAHHMAEQPVPPLEPYYVE